MAADWPQDSPGSPACGSQALGAGRLRASLGSVFTGQDPGTLLASVSPLVTEVLAHGQMRGPPWELRAEGPWAGSGAG